VLPGTVELPLEIMFKNSLLSALLLLCAVFPSIAQEQSNTSNTGSIRGTVIDTKTSQPINGAAVSLHSLERSGGWNSDTTAADGSFTFRGLAAGRYQLSATHAGYLDSSRGQRRAEQANGVIVALTAGQEIGDAVVRLTPTGVIAGRIVNEREEPMPGVYVQTMKASYRNGSPTLAPVSPTTAASFACGVWLRAATTSELRIPGVRREVLQQATSMCRCFIRA
jgi:hypothetical protein